VRELCDGTAELLSDVIQMKSEPFLTETQLSASLSEWSGAHASVKAYIDANPSIYAQMTVMTEMLFEMWTRSRERLPESNPFVRIDEDALADPPEYLHGRKEAFGWPVVIGRLMARSEASMGWKQPKRKLDARTWAALTGWSFAHTTRAAAPQDDGTTQSEGLRRSLGDQEWGGGLQQGDERASKDRVESAARSVLSGWWLMSSQRSAILGYVAGREGH
jgi:hypothetical protein